MSHGRPWRADNQPSAAAAAASAAAAVAATTAAVRRGPNADDDVVAESPPTKPPLGALVGASALMKSTRPATLRRARAHARACVARHRVPRRQRRRRRRRSGRFIRDARLGSNKAVCSSRACGMRRSVRLAERWLTQFDRRSAANSGVTRQILSGIYGGRRRSAGAWKRRARAVIDSLRRRRACAGLGRFSLPRCTYSPERLSVLPDRMFTWNIIIIDGLVHKALFIVK